MSVYLWQPLAMAGRHRSDPGRAACRNDSDHVIATVADGRSWLVTEDLNRLTEAFIARVVNVFVNYEQNNLKHTDFRGEA